MQSLSHIQRLLEQLLDESTEGGAAGAVLERLAAVAGRSVDAQLAFALAGGTTAIMVRAYCHRFSLGASPSSARGIAKSALLRCSTSPRVPLAPPRVNPQPHDKFPALPATQHDAPGI